MNGRTCDSANDLKYARAGGAALAAAPDVHNVDELCLQDADIQGCAPIQQLSALKEELESAQSPIMRTVFSWLFPFGPGWNSGTLLRPLGLLQANVHVHAPRLALSHTATFAPYRLPVSSEFD